MKIFRFLAVVTAVAFASIGAFAQNNILTPYSRYGYGMLNDNVSSTQRAMGGVGYAMSSGRQANVMNPASYAAIDSLTFLFDMGMTMKCLWSQEGDLSENNFTAGLDYITMAFPVSKRLGASFGMLPFSSTGYSFVETVDNGSVQRSGSGDISLLYVGLGYNPIDKVYVGANFEYMFGTLTNNVLATTITSSSTLFARYMRVRDWKVDLGVQYTYALDRNNSFTAGITFSPGKSFHGETYGVYYDASLDTKADTTGYTKLGGHYTMPATWGAGVSYTWRNRLMAEADVTYQPWGKAKFAKLENFESSRLVNRYKAAVGLQYMPQPRGNYLQRTAYRFGAYANRDYITVQGNTVREYGVSLGLGLPIPSFRTTINLAFEYKHRQAHPTPLIKEQYFNITLGINFNEVWFRQNKLR